jgi:hypothetical protein
VARWEDAYDALIDVYSWWRTPQGRAYGERFGASLSRAEAQEQGLTPGVEAGPLGWDVAHSQELSAFGADPVYVDPDMQTVVNALASKFEPEALRPEDMITEAGFALLPHPVTDVDIHGKTMSWRAVMWYPTRKPGIRRDLLDRLGAGMSAEELHALSREDMDEISGRSRTGPTEHGLLLAFYHRKGDPDYYEGRDSELERSGRGIKRPTWVLTHTTPLTYGRTYREQTRRINPEGLKHDHPDLDKEISEAAAVYDAKSAVQQDSSGRSVLFFSGDEQVEALEPTFYEPVRYALALWKIMGQTIADRSRARPNRGARRQGARAGLPEKEVLVVTLRRPRERPALRDGEPAAVEWTRRWITSMHWRWQWHPTPKDPDNVCGHRRPDGTLCPVMGGYHAQILIDAYVKGPADKPLIPRKVRAFEVIK